MVAVLEAVDRLWPLPPVLVAVASVATLLFALFWWRHGEHELSRPREDRLALQRPDSAGTPDDP